MNVHHVAFLGAGLLGSGMVEGLLARGVPVTVWNRSPGKTDALAALGAAVASTPADAVRLSTRVHLCLAEDAAVDAVLAAIGPTGPRLVLDHSTCAPAGVAERATRLAAEGVRYLHCPVFMSPANARSNSGIVLASGDPTLFEDARPHLEVMGSSVLWLGARPDAAASVKLLGNAVGIGLTAVLGDVLSLSQALDVPLDDLSGLLDRFNPLPAARGRMARMASGELSPASFTLAMARKDVRLMLDAAGVEALPVLQAIAGRMDERLADGHDALDYAVIGARLGPAAG